MRDYHGCSICGRKFPEDALTLFAGDYFCEHCLDEETVVCSDCGERLWNDANAGSRTHPLCQRCYDSHYTDCERCGELIDCENAYYLGDGEDNPYCENCYHILKNQVIHNYDYRPETIFYGDGPRYFGVELEIDKGGEIGSNAEQILAVGNREHDFYYCKHDGSLDDGFEIVSHPATVEYHLTQLPWKAVMAEAVSLGYRSHQACTCGLHIHISRLAFGRTAAQQEAAIARLLYFVEKHWNELFTFSRRSSYNMSRWSARFGFEKTGKQILEKAKSGCNGRYVAVNLNNYHTIEFRLFRGTLKYNTFIATLQMVNHICDAAISLSEEGIDAMSWSEFVSSIEEPELIQYLKERRLYINEVVTESEEM